MSPLSLGRLLWVTAVLRAAARSTRKQPMDGDPDAQPMDMDTSAVVDAEPQQAAQGGDMFEADMAVKTAHDKHNMMHQFMQNFARNMKYAVLEDSQGDMPEEERQRLMNQLRNKGANLETPGGGPDQDAEPMQQIRQMTAEDEESAEPMSGFPGARRPRRRPHMLNQEMGRPPAEAEGPPPEMAMSPAEEDEERDRRPEGAVPMMPAEEDRMNDARPEGAVMSPAEQDMMVDRRVKRRRHHRHSRMLNQRLNAAPDADDAVAVAREPQLDAAPQADGADPASAFFGRRRAPQEDDAVPIGAPQGGPEEAPPAQLSRGLRNPRVVDELGRPMPLLFGGEPQKLQHSGTRGAGVAAALVALMATLAAEHL